MTRTARIWTILCPVAFGVMFAWALVQADVPGANGIPADVLARSDIARANMMQIASAMSVYANENWGVFPPDIRMLYPGYISDPAVFWHPGDSDPKPTTINNNTQNQPNSTRISFEFTAAASSEDMCEGDPLIWDNSSANNGGLFVNKLTARGVFRTDPSWITPTPTRRQVALTNLKFLSLALAVYANDNNAWFPTDLIRLVQVGGVCSPSTFWNPGDSEPEPTQITNSIPNAPNSTQISYAYFGGRSDSYSRLRVVLGDNSLANNEGQGVHVVTDDFAVAFFEPCSRSLPSSEASRANLLQIGQALHAYASANAGQFPARLSMLYPAYIAAPAVFWNPGDNDPAPTTINNDTPNGPNSAQISYHYLGAGYTSACGAGVILAEDNSLSSNGGIGINILTADGAATYFAPAPPSCQYPSSCMSVAAANLKQIGMALFVYANDSGGHLPPRLSMLYPREIPRPTTFWHPRDADPWPLTIDNDVPNQPNSAQISYEYVAAGKDLDSLGSNDILVRDNSRTNNGGIGVIAVYADGHVAVPRHDLDYDGDVDLIDFERFRACFNGSNRPPAASGCTNTDFDCDGDVDLLDFGAFRTCFNGSNRPKTPACQ